MARGELLVAAGLVLLTTGWAVQAGGCRATSRDLRGDCEAVAAHLTDVGDALAAEHWDAEHDVEAVKRDLRERLEPAQADKAIDILVKGWSADQQAELGRVRSEMSVLAGQLVPACVEELRGSPDRERVVSCLIAASDASEISACGEFGFLRPS